MNINKNRTPGKVELLHLSWLYLKKHLSFSSSELKLTDFGALTSYSEADLNHIRWNFPLLFKQTFQLFWFQEKFLKYHTKD